MPELSQLEQLVCFAQCGTLSQAAQRLHLTQPALSRSMQRLEEEFRVPLFERRKNRLTLNENGQLAVQHAQRVLDQTQEMLDQVRAADRARRTISAVSCAPAPLWELAPLLSSLYPGMTISTGTQGTASLLPALRDGTAQLAVLPYPVDEEGFYCLRWGEEQLFLSAPEGHPLAQRSSISFAELDGETLLLFSDIGFWHELHAAKLPHARFLLQGDRDTFKQLVHSSSLLSFVTDVSQRRDGPRPGRVRIPIRDAEARVCYYCVCLTRQRRLLEPLFRRLEAREVPEVSLP